MSNAYVAGQMFETSKFHGFGACLPRNSVTDEQLKQLEKELPKYFSAPGTVIRIKEDKGDVYASVRMSSQFSFRKMNAEGKRLAQLIFRLKCVDVRPVVYWVH